MNKKLFEIYQYAAPAILTPLSFWLWWQSYPFAWLFPTILVVSIVFPVWGYRRRSFKVHGHSGCLPVERKIE